MSPTYWTGFWKLADPKITLASAASLLLGASAAAHMGSIDLPWLAVTVLGVFCIEVAKNASGEVFDFDSGADLAVAPEDRSPFSGGKRVLVDRLLTRAETVGIASAAYALAALAGLAVVAFREPRVLWLGLSGAALAYFYHAPPLRLSYRGLGEAAVGLAYGPGIAAGTYLVQRGRLDALAWLTAMPLGVLIAAFLWINEFPDYLADRSAGKRTLVVRLGRAAAGRIFTWLEIAPFAALALLPLAGWPWTVWLGLAGLPFGLRAAQRLAREPENTGRIVPAQGWALLAFLLFAGGTGLGLLIAPRP